MGKLCEFCGIKVGKYEADIIKYCDETYFVHKRCAQYTPPIVTCDICKQSGYCVSISWKTTGYNSCHVKCIPESSDTWWPIIRNFHDFKTKGKQLTREVKNVMMYIYWILRNRFKLPRDIVYHIMGISIYPHGPIAQSQNGLSWASLCKLSRSINVAMCNRCGCYYDTNIINYKIKCYNGPCYMCGTPHCKDICNYLVDTRNPLPNINHELMTYSANFYQLNVKLKYLVHNNLVTPEEKQQIYLYFTTLIPF